MNTSDTNTTSFWKRPEGKAGYILLAVLAVPAALLINLVFPILITAATNIYMLGGLLAGLGLIYKIVTSDTAWYLFQMISRWMTSLVIDLDPVSIMQSFLAFAIDQRAKLVEAISEVQGAKRTLDMQVAAYRKNIKEYQSQAEAGIRDHAAAGTSVEEDLSVNAALENAAAIKRASDELAEMSVDLDSGIADLIEALKRVDYEISTTKTQVQLETQRHAAAQAMGSANNKISAVLAGGAKREMYDAATDRIRTQYNEKRAKLEILVETSRTAAGSIDLNKRALRNEGLADLKKQLGTMGSQGLLTAGTPSNVPAQLVVSTPDAALSDFLSVKK
jgi:phage shock protein A